MRNCRIGKHCYIATQCIMNNTHIGNYTCIAPHVQIGGMQHSYWYPSISPILSKENINKEVHIGNDVWIAAGAIIAQGITIGNGAVIGANSFVNKDVPPYAVVAGVPARIIASKFTREQIIEHESILYPEGERMTSNELQYLYSHYYQEMKSIGHDDLSNEEMSAVDFLRSQKGIINYQHNIE